jgi:hypothetical protein
MTGIRFGCGEFVPGGEPITVPSLNTPVPTTIIPRDVVFKPKIPPFIPVFTPPPTPNIPSDPNIGTSDKAIG